jgi:twinkle protein
MTSETKILGPIGLKTFEGRGLNPETIVKFDVYTARRDAASGDVLPDIGGNIVVFPFVERGVVVNEKYRAPGKKFWQRAGGRRTFWNSDALDDPALAEGRMPLVITEGEIDALTAIDCGFPLTVSVPDGAPPVPESQQPDDLQPIDPAQEAAGKFEFLWNNRERLARVKRFVIAVDNDPPGRRLAAELVRRLSASRCSFVTYPDSSKDLNDVLKRHGAEAVARVLNAAQPYPVRGLYRLSEYPEAEMLSTFSTGWFTLDGHLTIFPGEFMVVTGIPSHGKSTWVLNLLHNLAVQYGWRSAVFSPEMPTVPHLRDKLRRIRLGRPIDKLDGAEIVKADRWIEEHFVFIDADPTGRQDEDFDLDWLLDRATDAVLRDGILVLLIDPWNEIDHARRRDETMTEYIARCIRDLKRFPRLYEVVVIVVAHPTKDIWEKGKTRSVTLYDIEGSASWFNKCDHGVVIERPDPALDEGVVRVAKVRFEGDAGTKGYVRMRYDRMSGRFDLLVPRDDAEQSA